MEAEVGGCWRWKLEVIFFRFWCWAVGPMTFRFRIIHLNLNRWVVNMFCEFIAWVLGRLSDAIHMSTVIIWCSNVKTYEIKGYHSEIHSYGMYRKFLSDRLNQRWSHVYIISFWFSTCGYNQAEDPGTAATVARPPLGEMRLGSRWFLQWRM